jgi:hypothetical protein
LIKHALSGKPEIKEFDPIPTSVQTYQDEDYQPIYFIADSFEKAKEMLRFIINFIKNIIFLAYILNFLEFTRKI